MATDIYRPMMLLSVLCATLGLSTVGFKQKYKMLNIYASFMAIVCSILDMIYLFVIVFHMTKSSIHIVSLASSVTSICLVMYYRFKFSRMYRHNRCILDNINCIDKVFNSVGIKVPHAQNAVECTVLAFTVLTTVTTIVYGNKFMKQFFGDIEHTEVGWNLYSQIALTIHMATCYFLLVYFAYVNNIIFGRLRILRRAIENAEVYRKRNIAWIDVRCVSFVDCIRPETERQETIDYFQKLKLIHERVSVAFSGVEEFFTLLIVINFVCTIIFSAVNLIFFVTSTEFPFVEFVLFVFREMFSTVLPVLICRSATWEFERILLHIVKLKYDKEFKFIRHFIKKWCYQHWLIGQNKMNCKYFSVDYSLIIYRLNIIYLIVFALKDSV